MPHSWSYTSELHVRFCTSVIFTFILFYKCNGTPVLEVHLLFSVSKYISSNYFLVLDLLLNMSGLQRANSKQEIPDIYRVLS